MFVEWLNSSCHTKDFQLWKGILGWGGDVAWRDLSVDFKQSVKKKISKVLPQLFYLFWFRLGAKIRWMRSVSGAFQVRVWWPRRSYPFSWRLLRTDKMKVTVVGSLSLTKMDTYGPPEFGAWPPSNISYSRIYLLINQIYMVCALWILWAVGCGISLVDDIQSYREDKTPT